MPPDERARPGEGRAQGLDGGPDKAILSQADAELVAWQVVREAEVTVDLADMALLAMRSLSSEQLRSVVWLGLVDEGWSRVFAELAERGEAL